MLTPMKTLMVSLLVAFLAVGTAFAQESTTVDWKTLATEFSEDAAAAQAKYQDKMLTVSGPVSAVAGGDMTVNNPSVAVTLSTPDGPGTDVKCLFENEDFEPNTEIHVSDEGGNAQLIKRDSAGNITSSQPIFETGQQIVVTGSFLQFSAGDVVLRHCRLNGNSAD